MAAPLKLKVPEADFQHAVIDLAHALRWKVAHFRPGMTARGWRTPVAADAAGWPDLVLVRDRLVFAELKGTGGQLRPEQKTWRDALRAAGAEVYVWFPTCWPEIQDVLTRRERDDHA